MRTVGEILRKARLEKGVSLEEIESNLKIRKKFLIALEDNAWEKLPGIIYIKGFLHNYSNFLGLKPDQMTAIFRRQFREKEKAGLLPEGVKYPLDEPVLRITPQLALAGILVSFLFFFFGYLILQYKAYTSPPNLTISKPLEGEILTVNKIQITGKTDIDAVVSINNQKVAISQNGEFSASFNLTPGNNTIVIESLSKYGKKRTITRTVQLQENPK